MSKAVVTDELSESGQASPSPLAPPGSATAGGDDSAPAPPPSPSYDELRSLLLAPEQAELRALRKELKKSQSVTSETVADALPSAVHIGSARGDALLSAMQPLVSQSLLRTVEKQPDTLVNVLFPVIGPAIRKAVADAMAKMLEQLGQTLDHAFSLRSWGWRIEALVAGKPFYEVVLLHSLIYRVEQVFLIHIQTGLLLLHVSREVQGGGQQVHVRDADLVSGMLTAIQDFVKDSFETSGRDGLDRIKVGDLTVLIERGPHAVLAAVVRGVPPTGLSEVVAEALEVCHREAGAALAEYVGDSSVFAALRPHLERCLQSAYEPPKPQASWPRYVFGALVIAGLWFGGRYLYALHQLQQRWELSLAQLAAEPGIVVLNGKMSGRSFWVHGLRDPDSRPPEQILKEHGFAPPALHSHWESYVALRPELVERRAKRALQPPRSVSLRVRDGVLIASGRARPDWISTLELLSRTIPGIIQLENQVVSEFDATVLKREFAGSMTRLEARQVRFAAMSAELSPQSIEEVVQAAADIRAVKERAEALSQYVIVKVVGSADPLGDVAKNDKLSQLRAEKVRAALVAEGVPPTVLIAFSIGAPVGGEAEHTTEHRLLNRSVFFRVSMASSNMLPLESARGNAMPAGALRSPDAAGMGR